MKISQIILVVIISVIATVATTFFIGSSHNQNAAPAAAQETAFDRIMRTNTLRCGYAIATPWMMVDPATNKLRGVNYDVTEAVAQKIGLKVDWVEETGWGVAEEGLITGRYDMMCGSVCIDPRRARAATFSTPFLHIPLVAVVRADDHRFDSSIKSINAKDVRVGVKNGDAFEYAANEQFPQAQKVYANDISDDAEFFEMLKDNKIDIAFSGQVTADLYNEKNPGSVRVLNEPVRFCNGAFIVPLGDEKLKNLIDNAIGELNSSGQIKEILNRYVKDDPRYVRIPTSLFQDK